MYLLAPLFNHISIVSNVDTQTSHRYYTIFSVLIKGAVATGYYVLFLFNELYPLYFLST